MKGSDIFKTYVNFSSGSGENASQGAAGKLRLNFK